MKSTDAKKALAGKSPAELKTELDALGIPAQDQSAYAACTDPKTRLLAFVDVKTAV